MKQRLNSQVMVRAELARRLGHPPEQEVWEQLEETGWIEDVILATIQAEAVRRLERVVDEYRLLAGTPIPENPPVRNGKEWALARIVSSEASHEAEVVRFRDEVHPGRRSGLTRWTRGSRCVLPTSHQPPSSANCANWSRSMVATGRVVVDLLGPLLLEYVIPADQSVDFVVSTHWNLRACASSPFTSQPATAGTPPGLRRSS